MSKGPFPSQAQPSNQTANLVQFEFVVKYSFHCQGRYFPAGHFNETLQRLISEMHRYLTHSAHHTIRWWIFGFLIVRKLTSSLPGAPHLLSSFAACHRGIIIRQILIGRQGPRRIFGRPWTELGITSWWWWAHGQSVAQSITAMASDSHLSSSLHCFSLYEILLFPGTMMGLWICSGHIAC